MVKKYLKKLRIAIFAGFPICRFSIESCMTKLKNYGYFSLEKLTKMDITNKKSWKELFEFPFNSVGIVSNNHYVIFAMFKSDVNDIFNYVCKDILIDNFEYMTVEYKWQVILIDSSYTDFNMCVPLGCKIASRMFDLLRKKKALCRGDSFDYDFVTQWRVYIFI